MGKYNRLRRSTIRRRGHRTLADMYKQDPNFRVVREGLVEFEAQLKKRMAELEKVDGQLMASVAWATEMEVLIQAKDEELQLGRVVAEEAAELRTRVAALTEEL